MSDDGEIIAPRPLEADDAVGSFQSGVDSLNNWLRKKAPTNQVSGASRTYVACADSRVVGYYALASGSVDQSAATGKVRRNMPDPVPVIVLGRLAIDQDYQGHGLGQALLRDAILRSLQAAEIMGIRAILVHAISEQARDFYRRHGFKSSPIDEMTLMITIREARQAVAEADAD